MVATGTTLQFQQPHVARREATAAGPVRFTLADTLTMIERGILPEDSTIELLNGALEYRDRRDIEGSDMPEGVGHSFAVAAIAALSGRIDSNARHLRSPCTLVCTDEHVPIPDAAILRGGLRDYIKDLPTAANAFCVIEVAASSYARDAGEKLSSYARAGSEQYIIINLRNRTAEVYATPDVAAGTYPPPTIVDASGSVPLRVGESETIDVTLASILP